MTYYLFDILRKDHFVNIKTVFSLNFCINGKLVFKFMIVSFINLFHYNCFLLCMNLKLKFTSCFI